MHSDDDAPKDLPDYCGLAGGATMEGGETTGCLRCVKEERGREKNCAYARTGTCKQDIDFSE